MCPNPKPRVLDPKEKGFTPLEKGRPKATEVVRKNGGRSLTGFTLIELLVQIAIFAVIASFLIGITFISFRVKNKSVADTEVLGQLNFVMQSIQRMTRESTLVNVPGSTILELQRAGATTTISLDTGVIELQEGANPETNLTNNQIVIDNLEFTRVVNSGAPDSVKISITARYNTGNPFASTTKTIQSSASPLY